jgi:hypothetical protein
VQIRRAQYKWGSLGSLRLALALGLVALGGITLIAVSSVPAKPDAAIAFGASLFSDLH